MFVKVPVLTLIFWCIYFWRCKQYLKRSNWNPVTLHWLNVYMFLFSLSFLTGYYAEVTFNQVITGLFDFPFPYATTLRNLLYTITTITIFDRLYSGDLSHHLVRKQYKLLLIGCMFIANILSAIASTPLILQGQYIVVHWWHGAVLCSVFWIPILFELILLGKRLLDAEQQVIMKIRYVCTVVR